MSIELYYAPWSPPCKTVLLVAEQLDVPLTLRHVDLGSAQHLSQEYLELNPQHKIPTLVDNGFALGESRAIIRYLANAYGTHTNLYPTDPKIRALVDHRLDFDLGTLYPSSFSGRCDEPLCQLDAFLSRSKFAAGEEMTIADLALFVTVDRIQGSIGIKDFKYPHVAEWYKQLKSSGIKV